MKIIREVTYVIAGLILYKWVGFEVTVIILLCFMYANIDHYNNK